MHTNYRYSEQIDDSIDKKISALNTQQLEAFFNKRSSHNEIAMSLTENVESKVQNALSSGRMFIEKPDHAYSSEDIASLNNKKHKLQKELEQLKHLIKSQKFKPLQSLNNPTISEEEHQKIVNKIRKEKKKTDEKREQYVAELQRKRSEEELDQRKKTQIHKERMKEEKRARISLEMKNREESKVIRSNSSINQTKSNKKLLYRQLESRYIKQVVLPAIEQKNNKLKEIRNLKRPIRIEEIRKHEGEYMKRREQLASQSLDKKQEWVKYEPSFKSSRLEKMRKEEDEEKKIKQEEKKSFMELKAERIQSFKKYVAQNFKPNISEAKRKELQQNIQKQTNKPRQVSKDLYGKGVEYLNYSKTQIKKQDNPEDSIIPFPEKQDPATKHRPNSNKPNYIRTNIKPVPSKMEQIDSLIKSSNLSSEQKMYELRLQTERINNKIQQKERLAKLKELKGQNDSSDLLLASIKARMGMLEIYNN